MPYPGAPMSPAGYQPFETGDISAESLFGPPPADRQAAIIAEIKRLAGSPNKAERERAEALVRGMGRNMFMVGLNRATMVPNQLGVPPDARGNRQGLSDTLLSYLGGDRGEYSPEGLAFSKELTQAARPDAYRQAENIGSAVNLGLHALPPWLLLRMLLAGNPSSTPGPIPQAPLAPGGGPFPGGIPPGLPPGVSLPQPGPIPMPPGPPAPPPQAPP